MNLTDVKTIDNEVEILEKFYEELYSKAGILYISIDPNSIILSCNVTAQENLGYEKEELCGKNFLDIFPSDYRQQIDKILDTCINRGFVKDNEVALQRKSSDVFSIRLSGLTQCNDEGNLQRIRFYIQDISEVVYARRQRVVSKHFNAIFNTQQPFEKKIERALEIIQEHMDCEGIGVFIKDIQEQHFSYGNWQGIEKPESESADFRRWLPETWQQFFEMCREKDVALFTDSNSLIVGSLSEMIGKLKLSDGVEHLLLLAEFETLIIMPLQKDGGSLNYLVMTHRLPSKWQKEDIELLEAQVSLFLAQTGKPVQVNTIQQNDPSFMLGASLFGVILVKEGIIEKTNNWICGLLGYTSEELEGKPLNDFISPESEEDFSRVIQFSQEGHNPFDLKVTTKDKKSICVECNRLQNESGWDTWFWMSTGDRDHFKEQLLQARKMESLGLLAGGIVHDFNNLLATILGYNSLLREEISEDSPYYDDIQQIARTSEKATELTSRLLAYAQGKSYIINDLDVNQLIREVAGILSRTLDKRIAIRAELEDDLYTIKADSGQIQQAILQVALNARDAMEQGGRVVFKTNNILLNEGDVRLREGRQAGRYIQLEISDTGGGISGQIKNHIFEPYFTTKDQTVGKGLGLSMVQEVVEKHGGFYSVFSEKSTGTVFKIYLPATQSRVKKAKASIVSKEKPMLGKETILLIDDEKLLKETARKMLTRYGYKVICAGSAPEAVAIYKKYMKRIDLVILDMIIPGMDVKQILNWFRRVNPKAKIIAATGLGEKEHFERNFGKSLSGFVQKPFQVRPLLYEVRNLLNA